MKRVKCGLSTKEHNNEPVSCQHSFHAPLTVVWVLTSESWRHWCCLSLLIRPTQTMLTVLPSPSGRSKRLCLFHYHFTLCLLLPAAPFSCLTFLTANTWKDLWLCITFQPFVILEQESPAPPEDQLLLITLTSSAGKWLTWSRWSAALVDLGRTHLP